MLSQVSNTDVLITSSDWDYYLFEYLKVFIIDYKNLKCEINELTEKYFNTLFPEVKKEFILDYLILQVKNEDDSI